AGSKGSVAMTSFAGKKKTELARPRSRIVGKDQPRERFESLSLLPDGRILVGYSGPFIGSQRGLQIRAGEQMAGTGRPAGAGPPHRLGRDGLLLAYGPLCNGYESCVHKVDLERLTILDTFPVCKPYLWLTGRAERLVGQTPAFPEFETEPYVAPKLVDRHPYLRRWVHDREQRLVAFKPGGPGSATLDAAPVGPQ